MLDVGCGDGALLEHLVRTKNVDGRGIELSQQNVNACVARGLAVVQGDADTDLAEYPAQVFDAVILSQTIQATEKPRAVLEHLLRIGRRAAISLPNFGYWKVRLSLLMGGRMPRTRTLDYSWYDTPNIHLCTLADFVDLTRECGATIVEAHALNEHGGTRRCEPDSLSMACWAPTSSPRARSSCSRKARSVVGRRLQQRTGLRRAAGARRGGRHKATCVASTTCTPPDAGKQPRAEPSPSPRRCRPAPACKRRRIKRALPSGSGSNSASSQQAVQFAAGKGPAMAEGRPLHLRPQAGAVGRHQQHAPFRRQHPPQLAQQRRAGFRRLPAHARSGCGRRTHREKAARLPRTRAARHLPLAARR